MIQIRPLFEAFRVDCALQVLTRTWVEARRKRPVALGPLPVAAGGYSARSQGNAKAGCSA